MALTAAVAWLGHCRASIICFSASSDHRIALASGTGKSNLHRKKGAVGHRRAAIDRDVFERVADARWPTPPRSCGSFRLRPRSSWPNTRPGIGRRCVHALAESRPSVLPPRTRCSPTRAPGSTRSTASAVRQPRRADPGHRSVHSAAARPNRPDCASTGLAGAAIWPPAAAGLASEPRRRRAGGRCIRLSPAAVIRGHCRCLRATPVAL